MAYTIQIKRSSGAPGQGKLQQGELGYDITAFKLYVGNGAGLNATPVRMGADEIKISDVTNLQTALDGKVPTSRTINSKPLTSDITLSASDVSAVPASAKGTANGVATLDANTQIPIAQIPSALINGLLTLEGPIATLADVTSTSYNYGIKKGSTYLVTNTFSITHGANVSGALWENWKWQHYSDATDPVRFIAGDMLVITEKDPENKILKFSEIDNNASDLYVPLTRKINNKLLSSDITLSAADVGAPTAFTGLSDAPEDFTNAAGKIVIVNATSNGLIFTDTLDCGSW